MTSRSRLGEPPPSRRRPMLGALRRVSTNTRRRDPRRVLRRDRRRGRRARGRRRHDYHRSRHARRDARGSSKVPLTRLPVPAVAPTRVERARGATAPRSSSSSADRMSPVPFGSCGAARPQSRHRGGGRQPRVPSEGTRSRDGRGGGRVRTRTSAPDTPMYFDDTSRSSERSGTASFAGLERCLAGACSTCSARVQDDVEDQRRDQGNADLVGGAKSWEGS